MSIRERIFEAVKRAAEQADTNAPSSVVAGYHLTRIISEAAAREALLIAKELTEGFGLEPDAGDYARGVKAGAESIGYDIDQLLAELSDGQTAEPKPEIR